MSADPPPSDFTTTIEIPVEPLLAVPASVQPDAPLQVKAPADDAAGDFDTAPDDHARCQGSDPGDRVDSELIKLSPPGPGGSGVWRPGEIPLPAFRLAQLVGAACIGALTAVAILFFLGSNPGHERSSGSIKLLTESGEQTSANGRSADGTATNRNSIIITAVDSDETGQVPADAPSIGPKSPGTTSGNADGNQSIKTSHQRDHTDGGDVGYPTMSEASPPSRLGRAEDTGTERDHRSKPETGSAADPTQVANVEPRVEVATGPTVEDRSEQPVSDQSQPVSTRRSDAVEPDDGTDSSDINDGSESQIADRVETVVLPTQQDIDAGESPGDDQHAAPSGDVAGAEDQSNETTSGDQRPKTGTTEAGGSDLPLENPEEPSGDPDPVEHREDNGADESSGDESDTVKGGGNDDDTHDDDTHDDDTGPAGQGSPDQAADGEMSEVDTAPATTIEKKNPGKTTKDTGDRRPKVEKARGHQRPSSNHGTSESKSPRKQRGHPVR